MISVASLVLAEPKFYIGLFISNMMHTLLIEPLACGYIDCLPEHYRANVSTYTQQRDLILDNTHAVASDLLFRVIPRWSAQLLRSDTIYLVSSLKHSIETRANT